MSLTGSDLPTEKQLAGYGHASGQQFVGVEEIKQLMAEGEKAGVRILILKRDSLTIHYHLSPPVTTVKPAEKPEKDLMDLAQEVDEVHKKKHGITDDDIMLNPMAGLTYDN